MVEVDLLFVLHEYFCLSPFLVVILVLNCLEQSNVLLDLIKMTFIQVGGFPKSLLIFLSI
jgi:hypothetical protein